MVVRVYHDDYRSRGEAVMRTFLIAFTAIVLLAGYTVQPPEKTGPYRVALTEDDWYLLLRTLAAVKKCAPMSLEIALNCISYRIKTGLEEEKNKIF